MLGYILNLCVGEKFCFCAYPANISILIAKIIGFQSIKQQLVHPVWSPCFATSLPMGFQLYIREKQMLPDSCHTSQLYCARLDYNPSGCLDPIMYPFKNYYHCHASIIIWAKVLSNHSGLLVGLHI